MQKSTKRDGSLLYTKKIPICWGGDVTLDGDGAGTYRIYLQNRTGHEASGDIYIEYSF